LSCFLARPVAIPRSKGMGRCLRPRDDAKDFARRLRKGTGADATASGATRVSGTVNYKRKYEPDFPTVTILQAFPGRIIPAAQLEALGLVSPPEKAAPAAPLRVSPGGRSWPDYQRCVQGAPMQHGENKPDVSRADFFFSMLCTQRGWSIEEVTGRLMELSRQGQRKRRAVCAPNSRKRHSCDQQAPEYGGTVMNVLGVG
jgi:hypothetical protein